MSRPLDWAPLAGSDPVPGDVHRVRDLATRYSCTAQEIREQAANLRVLAQNEDYWHAESGRRYAQHAHELAGQVTKAEHRYTVVRDALRTWADDLEHVQQAADAALRQAQDAQARIDAEAHTGAASTPPGGVSVQSEAQAQAQAAAEAAAAAARAERLRIAHEDLERARRALQHAVHEYDSAGRSVARTIDSRLEHDPLNDSRWDKVKDFAVQAVQFVTDVAGWVATIAGVLGVVCMFIPFLQPLGLLLLSVSEVMTYVSLAGHTALALTGNGSWGEVAFDLAAVGVIRVAGALAKAGVKATRAGTQGAARAGRARAAQAARDKIAARGEQAASTGRRSGSRANRAVAEARRREVERAGREGATRTRQQVQRSLPTGQRDLSAATRSSVDPDVALQLARARAAAQAAPHDAAVQRQLADLERAVRRHNTLWAGAAVADGLNKEDEIATPWRGEDSSIDMVPGHEKHSLFAGVHEHLRHRVVTLP